MSTACSVRGLLLLTMTLGLGACAKGPSPNPPVTACPDAEASLVAACCPGGPAHGDGPGLNSSSVTYTDCGTGDLVTVACSNEAQLAADQTTEGPQQSAGEMSGACQDAITAAEKVCPGYDPSLEAQAIQCPEATDWTVLPSCAPLEAMAADSDRCSLLELRGWQPVSPQQAEALRAQLKADPEDVTLSPPPAAEAHDDGLVPPVVTGTERDPNRLLASLRLEVPGNFLRYQLAQGPLRFGIEQANEVNGFSCDPEALKCLINPLALVDLSDALPLKNGLSAEFNPVSIEGRAAWRLEKLRYDSVLSATWAGHVDVTAENIELDLGSPRTRLSLLPVHMPNDRGGPDASNSYPLTGITFPDRQRNMIDQALIVTHLDSTTCWQFTQNPSYLTYAQPVICNCPSGAEEFGYCVTELSPRERPKLDLLNYAVSSEHAFLVMCTDPVIMKVLPYRELFAAAQAGNDPDLINMKITSAFDSFFAGQGSAEFTVPVATARADVEDFGCSGRLSKYARVGEQVEQSSGGATITAGEGASSALGIGLSTPIAMGGLDVEISSGRVQFTVPVLAHFEEWVKKKFGSIVGWFLKWVLKILSGVVNVTASFDMPPIGLPNAATLRLGDLELNLQAVLSQVGDSGGAQQGLALGMRRITTNAPVIDDSDWKLDVRWDTPSCDALTSDKASLLQKFKALIGCPFEIIANTAAELLAPVTTFLGKELLEAFVFLTHELNNAVFDSVVTSVKSMDNGNIVARLLQDAGTNVLFEPYYINTLGDADKAAVGALPPLIATACAAAPNPSLACALMHLMMGNGLAEATAEVQILRVGAKTHYRSMQDFELLTPSDCFPPVRFCVVGDDPPGAVPFGSTQRAQSQDFNEVDVAEAGGLDWRHQCAMFMDLSARAQGRVVTPEAAYEIAVRPSARTQTLMNEIFVCRNSAYCHPGASPNHLAERAELAACSLLGDIWGHVAASGEPYVNELFLLTTVTDPDGVAALRAVWDSYLGASGLGAPGNAFVDLVDFATACQPKLQAAGYPAPPQTLPVSTVHEVLPYACAPRFLP